MAELDTLKGYLDEAGLKYLPADERTLLVFFQGSVRDHIVAQLACIEGLVIAASPVPTVADEKIVHNLLRATVDTDMMKLIGDNRTLLLCCEAPFEHVRPGNLAGMISQLVQAVDIAAETLGDLDALRKHMLIGATICRRLSGPMHTGDATAQIPKYAQAVGVEHVQLDDWAFRVSSVGNLISLNIVVFCRDTLVSFVVFTDIAVGAPPEKFYRNLLELNRRVNVVRLTLDKNDTLSFMYEVPGLDEETFRRAIVSLEETVALYAVTVRGEGPPAG